MNLLHKAERKFGRFAIKNLMMYVVSLNLAVYLFGLIDTSGIIYSKLLLVPAYVYQGEIWRLVTFIFIPPATSILWILFTLYFYYMVGAGLEQEWGSFKFNIYYFTGMIGTIISAFISGGSVTAFFLNLSLFLAFAFIYPNYQILLFFVLPVRIKYLAWLDAAFLAFSFITGSRTAKLSITAAILNFLLFFGKDIVFFILNRGKAYNNKWQYSSKIPVKKAFHRCTVCGITEKDDKNMEFRYCRSCEGDYEYCMSHLKQHEHVKKA